MGKKTEMIKLHVSPETKELVQKRAQKKGLSVSSYVRMQLKEDIPSQVQQA